MKKYYIKSISLIKIILSIGVFLVGMLLFVLLLSPEKLVEKTLFQVKLSELDFDQEVYLELEEKIDDKTYIEVLNNQNSVSTELRRWGIIRNKNNEPPVSDPGAEELLKKYSSFYLGDTSKKIIYLTFDEGYENGFTNSILDTLKKNNVKATFFITGPYLNEQGALVKRMVEEGHEVGNHTVHHYSLPMLTEEKIEKEIMELDRIFYEMYNKRMTYLRPPKGEYSERSLSVSDKLGYKNVFWSFAYDDWDTKKQRGEEYAYKKVMDNLHNGAIILLHAVSSDNALALEKIIVEARKKGYEFGDIRKLEIE